MWGLCLWAAEKPGDSGSNHTAWRGFGRKGGAWVRSFIGVVVKGQGPSRDAGFRSLLQKHQVSPPA